MTGNLFVFSFCWPFLYDRRREQNFFLLLKAA